MISLSFSLVATLAAAASDDASLNALCIELSAGWQGGLGHAPVGLGSARLDEDPAQDFADASVWTCEYTRKPVVGATAWGEVATIRVRDTARSVDATHLALALRDLGWVHLGLLFDVVPGAKAKGAVVAFEVDDLFLGPEPEILVISEVEDQHAFERTARLCVDRRAADPPRPALCVSIPLAFGEGKRARKTAENLGLRLERDGRVALDQPRDIELDQLAPLAGVHDLGSLEALGRSLGPCEGGPCLRFYVFDDPVAPAGSPSP